MNKPNRLLTLAIALTLALASCKGKATDVPIPTQTLSAKLELSVQVDTSAQYTTVGQIIKFNFPVKNSGTGGIAGTVTLAGVAAICPALNTVGNGNDSLDQDETIICTTDYPLTQADLDKGSVSLAVTAAINGVNSNQATANVPVGAPKVLSVTVSANPNTYSQAGQKITFTYVIKNDGTNNLGPAQFTVSDNLISSTPINCGNPDTTLPPGQTVSCSAEYTITDANMAQVSIPNQASASGGGSSTTQPGTLTISKGGDPKSGSNPGTTKTHTVSKGEWIWQLGRCYATDPNLIIKANPQLANPSQITEGMVLTIPNVGSKGTPFEPCMVKHTVVTGDTWESIAKQYNADPTILRMVKANSLSVGSIVYVPKNSAGASSSNSSGSSSAKSLTVSATASPASYSAAGQNIAITYVIKNTGGTTLGPDQFKVKDTLIGNDPFNCGNPNTSIPPNLTITCAATYTIKNENMNVNSLTSAITALGGGVQSQASSLTINKGAGTLTLAVSANPTTYSSAGQPITFNYVITNSGASSLGPAQFTITDTLISPNPFNCGNENTTIAPNATVACSATYTIAEANMGQNSISNNATASGGGAAPSAPVSLTINKAVSGLSLTVSATPTTYNQAGQIITFNYEIKNNGTVSLGPAQFTIKDDLIGPTEFNCGEPNITLAPNATVACIKTYEITDAEMQESAFANSAVALGAGAPASPAASATITKQ